jgi:TatA/E family protein of Tat protein translocase
MFGMSGTELVIILVLALLLLGPEKLPEVAKLLGKGMRDFQKATDDIKNTVESEFNKIAETEPVKAKATVVELKPAQGAIAANGPVKVVAADPDPAAAPAVKSEGTPS